MCDFYNGLGKVFFTIAAVFAEAEREAKASGRAKGKYLGGSSRFGWGVDENGNEYEIEREQEAIREMIAMKSRSGISNKRISELMSIQGFEVSEKTVWNILKRSKENGTIK